MVHQDQLQHRISQVYLKSWSFKNKKNADAVCILRSGNPITYYRTVKKFTAELNLFDTTLFEEGQERFFDKMCIQAENNFAKVLEALSTGSYDCQTRIYLAEFAANLFVRQESTFKFFKFIATRKPLRKKLFKEIAILDEERAKYIEEIYEEMTMDPDHTLDSKVSAIVAQAWTHFMEVFKRFNHVILKAPQDRHWFTTTNPVMVKQLGWEGWIVGTDAEVYFPISKDYLLYMYFEGSHPENPLTKLVENSLTEVTLDTCDSIFHNIIKKSNPAYFILGEDMGHTDVRDGRVLPWYQVKDDQSDEEDLKFSFMGATLPPSPDDADLKKLLKKMGIKSDPIVLDVETQADAKQNECVAIVDKMVEKFGGSRLIGWQFWKAPYFIEAEFHAVWRTLEGQLKDVSFKQNKVTKIVFIEDPDLNYSGRQINNVRMPLYNDLVIAHFIEVCDILFKLYNKGNRANLYGVEFAKSLKQKQLHNLQGVEAYKQYILKFLNDGGNEDSQCFCNQPNKYKDCHAKILPQLRHLD